MNTAKKQMQEAAVLYYEKKHTQSEIADIMNLSRQTVSKLLNDAIKEKIVEIKINIPEETCKKYEERIKSRFGIKNAIVCSVSSDDEDLRFLMMIKAAAEYVISLIKDGNKKIGISWGRTIQWLIYELCEIKTSGNCVFPLFGATDQEQSFFASNELARSFADKIGAKVKYAWFPYRPDNADDCKLFKNTSYYKKIRDLWNDIDVAVVGIGSKEIIRTFSEIFGYNEKCVSAVGDVATHFFDRGGKSLELYEDTLCASAQNIKNAKPFGLITILYICAFWHTILFNALFA